MSFIELVWDGVAIVAVFFLSDLVYALDHYFVHHDKERFIATHGRHHRRYNRAKDARQLDRYELSTYTSAAVMLVLGTSVLSLFTGVWGFVLGGALKYAHSLLLHLYQHRWWGPVHLKKLALGEPRRSWGFASARYHAWHHSNPADGPFTYAETWAGFDRVLEWTHPWLVRWTADARRKNRACAAGIATVQEAS